MATWSTTLRRFAILGALILAGCRSWTPVSYVPGPPPRDRESQLFCVKQLVTWDLRTFGFRYEVIQADYGDPGIAFFRAQRDNWDRRESAGNFWKAMDEMLVQSYPDGRISIAMYTYYIYQSAQYGMRWISVEPNKNSMQAAEIIHRRLLSGDCTEK